MNWHKIKLSLLMFVMFVVAGGIGATGTRANPVDYLGNGFNSVQKEYIYDNKAVEFSNKVLTTVEGVNSVSDCWSVYSDRDLEKKIATSFFGSGSPSCAGVTAITDATKELIRTIDFSEDKITIVACWRQNDSRIYSNGLPKLTNAALKVLKSDPKRFARLYGDKYVSGVILGKMFFIVYQADIANYSASSKNAVRYAMELNLKQIMGGIPTRAKEEFIQKALSNVNIISRTIAYGLSGCITGPYLGSQFNKIKSQVSNGESVVIAKILRDYSYTANFGRNSFLDISSYNQMATGWEEHLSYLKYISSSKRSSTSLQKTCIVSYNDTLKRLALVYNFANNACEPKTEDISVFTTLYNKYLRELGIKRRWYCIPEISVLYSRETKAIDLNFSDLGDVEALKIELANNGAQTVNLQLYCVDGTNSALYKTVESAPAANITIYEGVKFCDHLRLDLRSALGDADMGTSKFIVKSSYLEKITNPIWLYLNAK
jgi:hypothetical protein